MSGTDKATGRPWMVQAHPHASAWVLVSDDGTAVADVYLRGPTDMGPRSPAVSRANLALIVSAVNERASLLSERDAAEARCAELERALRDLLFFSEELDQKAAYCEPWMAARAALGGKGGAT